jgi:integrase
VLRHKLPRDIDVITYRRGHQPSFAHQVVAIVDEHCGGRPRRSQPDRSAWGRTDLDGLTAAEVSEFVLANCRVRSAGSATLLVVGMRALLRYLYLAGLTPNRLAGTVPSAACWPASSLPRPIEPGEAARLMRSCDRRTATGRRDFAVLTVLLRLGLRVGEVAGLQLRDVDWRHGEILIRGKGRREERRVRSLDPPSAARAPAACRVGAGGPADPTRSDRPRVVATGNRGSGSTIVIDINPKDSNPPLLPGSTLNPSGPLSE